MSRTNIVKCVDDATKQEIYTRYKNKEERTKTKLAKKYGVSTRTLNRILDEMSEHNNKVNWDYCITRNELTIFKDEDFRSVKKGYPNFNNLKKALIDSNFSDKVLSDSYTLLDIKTVIEDFSEGSLFVSHKDATIHYGTFEVKHSLVTQIMNKLDRGESVTGMVKFLDKLLANPDKHIVEQLYPFMQHNDITISDEGDIIGFRAVNGEYKDYATGAMDNSVGNTLKMPRNLVNCNPEITCSTGLHVSAREYAENFIRDGGKLLKVKVNPKDVCSIPVDYDGQKMRCCEFTVLEDIT